MLGLATRQQAHAKASQAAKSLQRACQPRSSAVEDSAASSCSPNTSSVARDLRTGSRGSGCRIQPLLTMYVAPRPPLLLCNPPPGTCRPSAARDDRKSWLSSKTLLLRVPDSRAAVHLPSAAPPAPLPSTCGHCAFSASHSHRLPSLIKGVVMSSGKSNRSCTCQPRRPTRQTRTPRQR